MLAALANGVTGARGVGRWIIDDASEAPSRMPDCSHLTQLGKPRYSLDEETTDWRAVCGKTARTVRRAGSAKADPDPYQREGEPTRPGSLLGWTAPDGISVPG
jgi:hypothetical protein